MSKCNSLAWETVEWPLLLSRVRRLQRRIYKAKTGGSQKNVYWLQKTVINSLDFKLLAVRQVTTLNKGRTTSGIDEQIIVTSSEKINLAMNLSLDGFSHPIKRVWIPKPGKTEKRPLGPTIRDLAKQALAKLALEPEWEAVFEANSYGFRPGRSAHDAIEAIFNALSHGKPKFVFHADIRKCFDRIDHSYLIAKLNTFPQIERQVYAWLKAGIIDEISKLQRTEYPEKGTPQGGILSPLLANIALHGLELHLKEYICGVHFDPFLKKRGDAKRSSLSVIRYADDFVIVHQDLDILNLCINETKNWLKQVGLEISPDKSSIRDARNSFSFLGFHITQIVRNEKYRVKITPSRESNERLFSKLRDIVQSRRSASAYELILKLRPVVIGWANYYKYCECSRVFSRHSHLIFKMLRAWAFRRHPLQGRMIVKQKYWPSGQTYTFDGRKYKDNWVFCGKGKTGTGKIAPTNFLPAMNWILFQKYTKIKGTHSPFDSCHLYWTGRAENSPFSLRVSKLYKVQNGRCTMCKRRFDSFSQLEVDHIVPRALGGKDRYSNLQLLDESCHKLKSIRDLQAIAENKKTIKKKLEQ